MKRIFELFCIFSLIITICGCTRESKNNENINSQSLVTNKQKIVVDKGNLVYHDYKNALKFLNGNKIHIENLDAELSNYEIISIEIINVENNQSEKVDVINNSIDYIIKESGYYVIIAKVKNKDSIEYIDLTQKCNLNVVLVKDTSYDDMLARYLDQNNKDE